MKKLLLLLGAVLVLAPAASAGGWATAGLSSLRPAGRGAGEDWPVDVTILQHGRTALDGLHPTISVRGTDGAIRDVFPATPTGKPGVYHAVVRFPGEGTWFYEVYDGFTAYGGAQTHTFKPVTIGPADAPASFPTVPVAGIALALLLAAGLVVAVRRGPLPRTALSGRRGS